APVAAGGPQERPRRRRVREGEGHARVGAPSHSMPRRRDPQKPRAPDRANFAVMWLRAYAPADCDAVVALWNETKRDTYDFLPLEQSRTVDEDRGFFRAHIEPRCSLWVAGRDEAPGGLLARRRTHLRR